MTTSFLCFWRVWFQTRIALGDCGIVVWLGETYYQGVSMTSCMYKPVVVTSIQIPEQWIQGWGGGGFVLWSSVNFLV